MNKGPREKPSRPLRMTRQRRLILAELQGPGKHLTADEAHSRVRRRLPDISLSTVYRNLDILSRAGLIRRLRLGGRQEQYDGGPGRHYQTFRASSRDSSRGPTSPKCSLQRLQARPPKGSR